MSPKIKGVPRARSLCLIGKLFSVFFITEFFFSFSKDLVGIYTSGRIIITFINRAERKGAFANITPLEYYFGQLLLIYKAHLPLTVCTEKTVRQIHKK